MSDVVVVRNADRRTIAHDLPELQTELDPAGGMLRVTVGLVAAKKEQIRVLFFKIVDDLGPLVDGFARIAGLIGDDDLVLLDRIAADASFEQRLFTMSNSIRDVHRGGRGRTSPFDFGVLDGNSPLPPLAVRQRFQVWKLVSKRLSGFIRRQVEVR